MGRTNKKRLIGGNAQIGHYRSRRTSCLLGKFEREQVDTTRTVAGDDDSVFRPYATSKSCIADKGDKNRASLEIPNLERIVFGSGDGTSPVGRQGHALDWAGMASECAKFTAGLQIPDLERAAPGGGDGAPPIRRHRQS